MKKLLLSTFSILGLIITAFAQPTCGGSFTDPAGPTANYANNSDYTVTICPTNPGDLVTVTFTSFNTEPNYDALYVFNGNSTAAPQISSGNPASNVPGGLPGGFWGSTVPSPITSSSADGCLTFRFRSDGSTTRSGWVADVTCGSLPTCFKPIAVTASSVTFNSATIGWSDVNGASSWEVIALPCGAPAPTAASVGQVVMTNPYVITDLDQMMCFSIYVRAICSATEISTWSVPRQFETPAQPPVCGGQFTDSGGPNGFYSSNTDSTVVICPQTANSTVTVDFTSFSTQIFRDALYIFDGNSIAAPQIASTSPAGSVPGGLAGGYYGTLNPGSFTSSDPSGCLTFRFRSDGTGVALGWIANITCGPQPTCLSPNGVTSSNVTATTATFNWIDNNSATNWEILSVPCGSAAPTASAAGQIVMAHPTTITELTPGTCYDIYVRSICTSSDASGWSLKKSIRTSPANDDCSNAIVLPISQNSCLSSVTGNTISATASLPASTCAGIADDDVWFKFTATSSLIVLTLSNMTGSGSNALNYEVYSGSCDSLTQFYCSTTTSLNHYFDDLVIGQTYYVRVYTPSDTFQLTGFDICVHSATISTCLTSQSVCGLNNYANKTGVPSNGSIGCLTSTPNPTYFNLKISESGPVNLLLTQQTIGSTFANLDVDYAAWGPFESKEAGCAAVSSGQAPGIGVPLTTATGCSFSGSPTENLNIANAVAGEFYIVLITNFSNQSGYINMVQTNSNAAGAGSIDCSGIRLNAFVDTNNNGAQDSNEVNFPLGQFQYNINNSSDIHYITSPSGKHTLYDDFSSNAYDLNYVINSEFSSLYSTSATYSNVTVTSGGMSIYNFPITSLQNYADIGVTLVPLSSPLAGFTYKNKIVYTNYGNQPIANGSLSFNKNPGVTITALSQTGTIATATGFTYSFTNLLPFESRSITVTMQVPAIPAVSLGDLLTNTASVTPVTADFILNNNSSNLTQIVAGSYDPNDKSESHGEEILFSSFGAGDYLYYTIRFENTGTAGALNVRVTDLLPANLNENSLIMLTASHAYTLDRVDKSLVWNFDNIQLPVSVANTDIGKGYINFKIKPNPGYAVGDIIPNTAFIYFDSNPAIITNTFTTEFVQTLANQYYDFSNLFVLSPVPVKNVLTISIKQTVTINAITIYNTLGQVVQVNTNPNQTIDVSGLKAGSYFIKIVSDKGTATSKFIKE